MKDNLEDYPMESFWYVVLAIAAIGVLGVVVAVVLGNYVGNSILHAGMSRP
jgi:hypothetical protein